MAGGGGADVRLRESVRGRTGPLDRITLGPTGTWAQVKGIKMGQSYGGSQAQAQVRNPFGPAGRVGKRIQAVLVVGGGVVHVDSRSAPKQEWGI